MIFILRERKHVIKKSRFTEEQIAFALKQAEMGNRIDEYSADATNEGNHTNTGALWLPPCAGEALGVWAAETRVIASNCK